MELNFECPVCLENYSNSAKALIIPCNHTMCEPCLLKLIQNQSLECPICRIVHKNLSISCLPQNLTIDNREKLEPLCPNRWKEIEKVHKQTNFLGSRIESLRFSYIESRLSITKIKSDIHEKCKIYSEVIKEIYQRLFDQANDLEKQLKDIYFQSNEELQKTYNMHLDVLETMQIAYLSNQKNLAVENSQIPSLIDNEANMELKLRELDSSRKKMTDKISTIFEKIEEIRRSVLSESNKFLNEPKEVISSEVRNGIFSVKQEIKNIHLPNTQLEKKARKYAQDELLIGWHVERKNGRWKKVPIWFETQLIKGFEEIQNEIVVVHNGKCRFAVSLEKMLSYKINNKDGLSEARKLKHFSAP